MVQVPRPVSIEVASREGGTIIALGSPTTGTAHDIAESRDAAMALAEIESLAVGVDIVSSPLGMHHVKAELAPS